jgi:hypothetical protein
LGYKAKLKGLEGEWIVRYVGGRQKAEIIEAAERDFLKQRKQSDI